MPRGRSRSQGRRRARVAASRLAVPHACDVCVVGGGASGLASALAAAEVGASVVVLERSEECGRTILATGNGRCNFANVDLPSALDASAAPSLAYRNAAFAAAVMGNDPTADIVRHFDRLGLAWVEDDGRLYPASRAAESVRAVLLAACDRLGVVLAPARLATCVGRGRDDALTVGYDELWRDGDFDVTGRGDGPGIGGSHGGARVAASASLACKALVIASGGVLTGASDAVPLASSVGLPVVAPSPVLCPLACADAWPALDGRRVRGAALLMRDGAMVACEAGEVLFRSHGLSGIVIFNLSRVAVPGDVISLDLVPAWPDARLGDRLRGLREGGVPLEVQLSGLVDPVIAREISRRAQAGQPCPPCAQRRAINLVKRLRFRVTGVGDATHAQVTRGGVDVSALDPRTLAARVPQGRGVFVCGEAVDVDGPCGGFNLAWAWRSGAVAGVAAARHATSALRGPAV